MSHGQFNNLLEQSFRLPTKKHLDKLHRLYDLDLFTMNVSPRTDINPDSQLDSIHSSYYSPHSFDKLKNTFEGSSFKSTFSIFHNNVRSLKSNLENLQSQS